MSSGNECGANVRLNELLALSSSKRKATHMDRWKVEANEMWREWSHMVPAIKLKPEWEIAVIPPFCGAMARFIVKLDCQQASVYLDCFESLGYFGGPYWEVYPVDGDVGRCAMADTDELARLIERSLSANT